MDDPSSPSGFTVFLAWLPLLVLIGAIIYAAHRSRRSTPPKGYFEERLSIERDSLEARRETNRLLAELAAKLER